MEVIHWFTIRTCLSTLLSMVCLMLLDVRESLCGNKLYKDASFPVTSRILGRNITCAPHIPLEFAGPTWTCADLRVDGVRLAYGYHPDVSVSGFCTDTKGRDNLGAICRELLWTNKIFDQFWAATVSEATCEKTRQKRAVMVENERTFSWENFKAGRGWLITMHCTILPGISKRPQN